MQRTTFANSVVIKTTIITATSVGMPYLIGILAGITLSEQLGRGWATSLGQLEAGHMQAIVLALFTVTILLLMLKSRHRGEPFIADCNNEESSHVITGSERVRRAS